MASPLLAAIQAAAAQANPAQPQPVRQLSIEDAVNLALEQNLGIQIQRLDPQVQDTGVVQARSFWMPTVSNSLSRNTQDQPGTSALSPSYNNGTISNTVAANQLLPWGGGNYNFSWNNQRVTSTYAFASFSPQLQSTFNASFTQPIGRNFKIDQVRQQVKIAGKLRDLSDVQLKAVVVQTMRSVKDAYWDLVYSINNLATQRQSLELSQQSLRDNEKRVQIGTMAPIDIVQAQAEVASNQQNVITAEAAIKSAEDKLRGLVFDPAAPNFWTMRLEPTDALPFQEQTVDVDQAVRAALENRLDLKQAKNTMDQSDINILYFRNQILPDVNATAAYTAFGIGGAALGSVDPTTVAAGVIPTRPIISQTGYGHVLSNVFTNAYPQWTFGVQVGYPLGASTAKANLERAKLQYQEAQTQYKNAEMQIVLQVRDSARQVQTNQERVKSARASRELQEKKLEAEEKKMAAGMSTPFFVIQAQRDLASARTVETQAISDFNKSLVDLDAVQQVPLNVTLGLTNNQLLGITNAASGTLSTGSTAIISR
ncbi:MAG TPA: TolC family protein [Vicinamibacterales bacterium]|nr:TolC family protein [Vicinamibacterales bacterium]